jgi:hypothetical protein
MKGEGSTVTVKTLGIFRLPPKLPWFDDIRSSADLFFLSRCRVEPELMEKAKAAVEKAKNTRTGFSEWGHPFPFRGGSGDAEPSSLWFDCLWSSPAPNSKQGGTGNVERRRDGKVA